MRKSRTDHSYGSGRSWTYRDREGSGAAGITKATVQLRDGAVRVGITGKRGAFPVAANRLPVVVTVALGTGPCGSMAFAAADCLHTGGSMSCR